MDILNWLYLAKNKFVRTTLGSTKDLMIFGSKVGFNKRGDLYQNYAMSAEDFLAINRPYKVYTAQLTQDGVSNNVSLLANNPLTIGVTYTILDDGDGFGCDFTNVGAPNNNFNTSFVATGATPNSWGFNTYLDYNTGAPVANVVENTTGLNLYYTCNSTGEYRIFIGEDVSITKKSVIVFVNGGNYTQDPDILVKANYTYEENVFYINTYDGVTPADNILSDSDRFYRTSIEIRVYN